MPDIKITMRVRGPDPQPLIDFIDGFSPGGKVAVRMLRQAMIMGVMRKVRANFIDRLARALQVTVVTDVESGTERVREAATINKLQGKLKIAYNSLDRATLGDNASKAKAARLRIMELREQVEKRLLKSTGSGQGIQTLSSMDAAMRRRAGLILNLLADPNLLDVTSTENATVVGMGKWSRLNAIKTPSATYRLANTSPNSQYTILFRQLEFGTGAEARGGGSMWYYGKLPIRGTKPMEVLFGPNNAWQVDVLRTIEPQLDAAIIALAPVFK